jgi:hypothetical protein
MQTTYSKQNHTFIEDGETINAIVYGGLMKPDEAHANCIIEDLGEGHLGGRYMLHISNDGWLSDNLGELESRLFAWMKYEGYEEDAK